MSIHCLPHNYQIAISLDIYPRMATQLNNLRQVLELLQIDEDGALVVTAVRFADIERETQVAQPTETRLAPLQWENEQ